MYNGKHEELQIETAKEILTIQIVVSFSVASVKSADTPVRSEEIMIKSEQITADSSDSSVKMRTEAQGQRLNGSADDIIGQLLLSHGSKG